MLPTLEPGTVSLVCTDPPYHRVKMDEAWDRQWPTDAAYLEWLGKVLDEFNRVLKPNGSLYLFASPQMAARVECLIGERFAILNSITWSKPGQSFAEKYGPENFRQFVPMSERIIFAEHFGADGVASGNGDSFLFMPIVNYLRSERTKARKDLRSTHSPITHLSIYLCKTR